MTPEYLYELADLADPDKLWQLSPFVQMDLPLEKRRQLDTGVALRWHAGHINELHILLGTGRSLLITPLSHKGTAVKTIKTPGDHAKFVKEPTP